MRVERPRLSYLQPKSTSGQIKRRQTKTWSGQNEMIGPIRLENVSPHVAVFRQNPGWNPSNNPPRWSSTSGAQLSLGLVLCLCMQRGFWNAAPPLPPLAPTQQPPGKKKEKKFFLAKHCWQFDGMKSLQGYDTVCQGCSCNRCYASLSDTVKLRLLCDSQGWWGSEGWGRGAGVIPVKAKVQFLTGWRRYRVVLFQLWLCDSCMSTRIVCGFELFFRAETPLKVLCKVLGRRGKQKKKPTAKQIAWGEGCKAGVPLFAWQHNITCHTALSCFTWNCCN